MLVSHWTLDVGSYVFRIASGNGVKSKKADLQGKQQQKKRVDLAGFLNNTVQHKQANYKDGWISSGEL